MRVEARLSDEKESYPYVAISIYSGNVFLMLEESTGIVLHSESEGYKVGEKVETLSTSNMTKPKSITIYN